MILIWASVKLSSTPNRPMGPHILNSPNKPKKNRTSKGHSKDITGSSAQISHPIRDIWKHQGAKRKKERVQSGVELPQLSWDPDTGWIEGCSERLPRVSVWKTSRNTQIKPGAVASWCWSVKLQFESANFGYFRFWGKETRSTTELSNHHDFTTKILASIRLDSWIQAVDGRNHAPRNVENWEPNM